MRFPRWLDTCIYLALALFLIWDFGSRLIEWLTTGQLRVWYFFGNEDCVIFQQEPIYFLFGVFTMFVVTVVALIALILSYVED